MLGNSTKVWIFILLASFSFLLVGYGVEGRSGLVLGFFIALIFNILIFYFGETHLTHFFDLKLLSGQDPWLIHHYLKKHCTQLDLQMPAVYLVNCSTPTAFCLGFTPTSSSICLTTGFLESFSSEDLEAVLAYQLCQISSLDNFAFGIASVLANTIVGVGQTLDRYLLIPFLKRQNIFLNLLSPLAWMILRIAIQQKTFFSIDLLAVKLLNERRRLAEVLWRLNGMSLSRPMQIPPCTNHLFILNPEGRLNKNRLLKSHPAIDARIRNLIGYYPI